MLFFLCCLQDASARCLAIEPTADVLDGVLIEAGVKAARDVADVWRGQQVRQRAERMVERQRLLVKDIDGGYRESAQSWRELLQQLKRLGLSAAPKLAIGDGSLG